MVLFSKLITILYKGIMHMPSFATEQEKFLDTDIFAGNIFYFAPPPRPLEHTLF